MRKQLYCECSPLYFIFDDLCWTHILITDIFKNTLSSVFVAVVSCMITNKEIDKAGSHQESNPEHQSEKVGIYLNPIGCWPFTFLYLPVCGNFECSKWLIHFSRIFITGDNSKLVLPHWLNPWVKSKLYIDLGILICDTHIQFVLPSSAKRRENAQVATCWQLIAAKSIQNSIYVLI